MKIVCYCSLIVLVGVLAIVSLCDPRLLNQNGFLVHFINHEILNIQAVLVTVSLVSISQTHFEFGRIERRIKERIFARSRQEINSTALVLIGSLFAMLFVLIFAGGLDSVSLPRAAALMKSGCLLLFVLGVLAMSDIIRIAYVLSSSEPIEPPPRDTD